METLTANDISNYTVSDVNGGYSGRKLYTPRPYENNKDIKGIYNYVTYTLQPKEATWSDIALRFCAEELGMHHLNGKGSVRMAAKLVQKNWGAFVLWTKKIYTDVEP